MIFRAYNDLDELGDVQGVLKADQSMFLPECHLLTKQIYEANLRGSFRELCSRPFGGLVR